MRNILLASTALVAFAGAAAAEVSLSGSAEMGVSGGDNRYGVDTTLFHQSVDVRFTLSGEADGGLSFGAVIDLDDSGDVAASGLGAGLGDVRGRNPDFVVFISGDFGTLTMGDTDGALDWAMQETNTAGNAGSIADDETSHAGYLGSYMDNAYNGQILRYEYAFGDFAAAVSVELDENDVRDPGFAIGATYTISFGGGSAVIGGGYQYVDGGAGFTRAGGAFLAGDYGSLGISAAVSLDSGFSGTIAYTVFDFPGNEQTHLGLGIGYEFAAIKVHANYGIFEDDLGFEAQGFGLSASYDLGGGLSAHVGYGDSDRNRGGIDANSYSLGLAMSF